MLVASTHDLQQPILLMVVASKFNCTAAEAAPILNVWRPYSQGEQPNWVIVLLNMPIKRKWSACPQENQEAKRKWVDRCLYCLLAGCYTICLNANPRFECQPIIQALGSLWITIFCLWFLWFLWQPCVWTSQLKLSFIHEGQHFLYGSPHFWNSLSQELCNALNYMQCP